YRLQVIELTIPPLRVRGDDILLIAKFLLNRYTQSMGLANTPELSPEALEHIRTYPWPGNIRELENAMQRAVILLEPGQQVSPELLNLPEHNMAGTERDRRAEHPSLDRTLHETNLDSDTGDDASLEDYFVQFVLEHEEQMNETELAQKLGISRKNLWERRQRLGIPRRKGR
ncbi:MAG: sigma-54-dependent Fis family transcriptional regulator, partial [Natronospirillum sp.]